MSLMHVFRASAGRRDGRDPDQHYQDGERDLTLRSQKRRDGTDEAALRHKPRYITEGERGAGFVEVARRLLADRA